MESYIPKSAKDYISDMADQVSMPDIYLSIRQLIENENANINDFVDAIKNDSMLTTKLERITHSQYFGLPRRAEDLYQAISLIGIIQLHDLILNSLSLRTFSSVPQQIFNLEAFWKYSIECGIAARTIAQYAQIFPINPYFTYGLLHEIGHAVMYVKSPELSLEALEDQDKGLIAQIKKEQSVFGFDYTQVGAALIKQWYLPDVYQQIAAFHHDETLANDMHRQAVRVTRLAHMVCQRDEIDKAEEQLAIYRSDDQQLNKLPNNIFEVISKEIDGNVEIVLDMLWPTCAHKTTATGMSSGS